MADNTIIFLSKNGDEIEPDKKEALRYMGCKVDCLSEELQELYEKYKALADNTPNVIFGGRLGEYKYYDMDKVILSALEKIDSISK